MRGATAGLLAILLVLPASWPQAQGTAPASPLTLLTSQGRRPVPTTTLSGQELIALDEVATLFQVTVREDTLAGGLTVTYRGRTIVVSSDQPMASVSGRVVALPSPAVRSGNRWFVPLDFLPRALGPIYDAPIELRRASRLLIVGDLRVPRVTGRIDALGPPTRATIDITPSAPVAVATEAGRVVIRITADAIDASLADETGGLIERIRPGDQPTDVTIVLGEGAGAPRVVSSDAAGATRIAIDVPPSVPIETSALPAVLPPAASPVLPLLTGSRAPLQTIVIDPGHGGDDTGARGAAGVEEKTVAIDVARRLRALIEARLGIRVILTREDDRAITLDERAAVANNSKADLFLSLHFNAAPRSAVSGAQVLYVRLDREGEDARRTSQTEAVPLPVLGGATRTIDVIRWDLAQARHVDISAMLAGILEDALRGQVPLSARPRREAPLRVLTGVNMPAALIEMGYLTNGDQERQARSESFQASMAQAIYDGIVAFRAHLEDRAIP